MAAAGAIDSNETDFNIPADSLAEKQNGRKTFFGRKKNFWPKKKIGQKIIIFDRIFFVLTKKYVFLTEKYFF